MKDDLSHFNDLPSVEEVYGDEQSRNNLQSLRSQLSPALSRASKHFKKPVVRGSWENGEMRLIISEGEL